MARNYESAILLTGDASGAVRAIELTDDHLRQLNARQQRNKQTTSEWSRTWDRATGLMKSAALGVGAVTAGFGALAVQQTRSIVQTDNQARALGITTAQLQAMQYAAGTAGLEQDKMGDILKDVSDKIGDAYANGGGEALEVIQNLGLSTADLVRMDPAEQLLTIGSALEGLQTQGERVNAMESIANDASLLLPLLKNNSAEFRRLMNQAYDLNIAIPDSDIQTYRDAYSAVYELRGASEGLFNTLISGIAQSDLSGIEQSFANLRDTVSDPQFQQAVVTIAQALVQMVDWAAEGMTEFTLLGQQIGTAAAHLSGYTNEVEDLQGKLQRLQSMKTGSLLSRAGLFDFGTGFDTYMSDSDIDEAIEHIRSRLADLGIETGGVATQTDTLTSSAIAAAAALNQQGTATTVQAKNLKTLIKTYDQQHAKLVELRAAREQITQAMADDPEHAEQYRRMLAEVDSQITSLTKSTTSDTDAKRAAQEAERAHQQALDESAQAYSRLFSAMSPVGAAQAEYDSTLADLKVELEEGTKSTLEYYAAVAQAAVEYNKAVKAADPYAETVRNLVQQYDDAYQKSQQLHQALSDLNAAYQRGDIDGQQYQRMVAGIRDEMRQLALESDPAAQEMARAWEEAADRIDETFADAFAGAFDSFDDFGDQLLDGFKRLLAELAYQATLKPVVVDFTSSVGSSLGIPGVGGTGGTGGSGGIGSLASLGKNLYNSVTSGFGNIAWSGTGSASAYGGSGFANAATSGFGQTGFMGGSLNNFSGMTGLGSLGAGLAGSYVGTELGSSLFGKNANSNYGAMAGGALGTYFGGPIGAFAGSALGGMLDSAFGSSRDYKAGFVNYAETPDKPLNEQFYDSGNSDRLVGGRESAFGSFGYTYKEKFDVDPLADFLDALVAVDNTIASGASAKQIDAVTQALDGYTTKVKNDPLGKILTRRMNVVEQALLASSSDIGDVLIKKVGTINSKNAEELAPQLAQALQLGNLIDGLSGNVQDYAEKVATTTDATFEEMLAEIQASVSNYTVFSSAAENLNLQFDSLADGAVEASNAVANLAGGVESLQTLQEDYYQNYFSEEERRAKTIDSLTERIAEFNLATGQAIESKGGLRDYIESLDLMTASGQQAYAAALQMVDVYDQLEEANDSLASSFDDLLSAAQSRVDSAQSAAAQAYSQFDDQSYQQQLDLLALAGRDQAALNLQRERELETIDESLRPIQERIWALQDEKEAHEAAQKAVTDYQDALASAGDQLAGTLGSISQWVDQQTANGGSPGLDLQESQAQFARQLIAAQNGDRNALQSITQYADRYLSAGQDYYGSGTGYQSIRDDVLDALEDLPDQVSAEEYIADEIKQALADAVDKLPGGIASALNPMFDALDSNLDGLLTFGELQNALNGIASDDQLRALIRQLDTDGDGQISALEAIKGSTDAVGDNTGSLEERSLEQLEKLTGLTAEFTRTTDQFVDLNGNMVSLRESINALGVAQDEIARIERERAKALQAEQEKLEKAREREAERASLETELKSAQSSVSKFDNQVDAWEDRAERETGLDVDGSRFERLLSIASGRNYLTADYDVFKAKAQKEGDPAFWYAAEIARDLAFRDRYLDRIEDLKDELNALDGSHANGLDYVPFDGYRAELHKGEFVATAAEAPAVRAFLDGGLPPVVMPPPSAMGTTSNALEQLLRENNRLMQENTALLKRLDAHGAASVRVAQAGHQRQIEATERGNRSLDDLAAGARLESAR